MNTSSLHRYSIVLLFLFFPLASVFSQVSVELRVSSHEISLDEMLEVTYAVKNTDRIPSLGNAQFPGWHIVAGPQTSQEMSSINGNVQRSISLTYYLKPARAGRLAVPGLKIATGGKTLSCPSQTVQVVNGKRHHSQLSPSQQGPGAGVASSLQDLLKQLDDDEQSSGGDIVGSNILRPGESPAHKIHEGIFIKVTPSKRVCYVGEPILVTYELFASVGSNSKVSQQPAFNGVSVLDLTEEARPANVTVNGKSYKSYVLRKVQLTPLQSGKIALGNVEVTSEVPLAPANDPYNSQNYTETIRNQPVSIDVKELPQEGRPADFSGAIGRFEISVRPDQASSPAGENNMLHILIKGVGNLQNAHYQSFEWPQGLDHYDGTDSQQVDKSAYPPVVSKSFDIPIVGNKEGAVTIPVVKFTYFDPEAGKYKTIQSEPTSVLFTKAVKEDLSSSGFDQSNGLRLTFWLPLIALVVIVLVILWRLIKKKKQRPQVNVIAPNSSEPTKAAPLENIISAEAGSKDEAKSLSPEPVKTEKQDSDYMPKTTGLDQPSSIPKPESEPVQQAHTNFPLALQELQLETDNKHFFQLAKDLLIQYLQEKMGVNETNLGLLQELFQSRDEAAAERVGRITEVLDRNLYSPFVSDEDRQKVSDALYTLLS